MQFLHTLDGLLEHIKSVEGETIELTKKAQLQMIRFIEQQGLTPDDETLEVMQYQDIIAQQLGATIEAIENAQTHLQSFIRSFSEDDSLATQNLEKMQSKLTSALERAKEKHSAFGGKIQHQDDDGVEFF
jgi:hypothetical protein